MLLSFSKMYTRLKHQHCKILGTLLNVAAWMGGKFRGEWRHIYAWLSSFAVHLKPLKVEMLVAPLCPALCDPVDCNAPGSSAHGILQGQNTGVGSSFLLQGIFPTQGQNPGLLHCRQFLYQLSHQGSPNSFKIKAKLKVIAESFLLSFSPDPVKKKKKSQEL